MKTESVFPNLSAELTRNGLTYCEFAKRLGMSNAAFSNKINGKTQVDLDDITKIIKLLNLDFNYLFEKRN